MAQLSREAEMQNFREARKNYNEARTKERKLIKTFLKENGYKVTTRGGKGFEQYKGRMATEFDLSNWKWINAKKGDFSYRIYLQAFDKNEKNGNHYVLMDRLAVYKYKKYNGNKAFRGMVITEIDLPMDDAKLKKLLDFLQ